VRNRQRKKPGHNTESVHVSEPKEYAALTSQSAGMSERTARRRQQKPRHNTKSAEVSEPKEQREKLSHNIESGTVSEPSGERSPPATPNGTPDDRLALVRDYRLRDLIERLDHAHAALDAALFSADPDDLLRSAADAAVGALAEATSYLIGLREQRLRPPRSTLAPVNLTTTRQPNGQRRPRKRQRAAEKRANRRQQRALTERGALFHAWKRERREHVDRLLCGPYAEAAQALLTFLDALTLDQAPALVALVKAGPWRNAPDDVRFQILSLVNAAIVALRERHDLPPFDDSLPPRTNAFLALREWLR
jgi:hypothetical protein